MFAQLQQQQRAMMGPRDMQHAKQPEPKPRLAKDEVELLEREFRKNPKPTSGRKREIADLLKVEHPRINNWFQNRRAKEKQMRKSREFEAQQSADGVASGASSPDGQDQHNVSEYYGLSNHSQPLQASSAAFPDTGDASRSVDDEEEEDDDEDLTLAPSMSLEEGAPSSEGDAQEMAEDQYLSPESLPFQPVHPHPAMLGTPFSIPSQSSGMMACSMSGGHLSIPTFDASNGPVQGLDAFGDFANVVAAGSLSGSVSPVPCLPSQDLGDAQNELFTGNINIEHPSPRSMSHQSSPDSTDMRFKSPPPPSNIASRRNRGIPAQLSTTALRSYSYGPKTGMDMVRRSDAASPMRRIVSATGTMPCRIQKPSLNIQAPRSPMYYERTKEALMRSLQQSARSPVMASMPTTLSPVTPSDHPFQGQQTARETTVSSSASDDEQRYTLGPSVQPNPFFSRMESTLKTPPGTPGLARVYSEQVLGLDSAWNYVPQDEPLVTPGLGSFGSEEFAMASSAPTYVVNSQPATPSFAPTMGPSYFAWGSNNAEYTFPSASYVGSDASMRGSPLASKSSHIQFTPNITPSDFGSEN